MLDENTTIAKPRLMVVDYSLFISARREHRSPPTDLEHFRKLSHGLNQNWLLWYVYLSKDKQIALDVKGACDMWSIPFLRVDELLEDDLAEFSYIAHTCDVGYTPTIVKTLPVNFLLRQPPTSEIAVDMICWFCSGQALFTIVNYYDFLKQYDA